MSNPYDKAHELARSIRQSEEMRQLAEAWKEVQKDPSNKNLLDSFRKRQLELQAMQMQGQQPPEEDVKELNRLMEKIQQNPGLKKYLEAETRFGTLMSDLNRIITEPVREIYDH